MNFEQLKSHVLIILLKYTGIYIQSFHSSLEQIQNTILKIRITSLSTQTLFKAITIEFRMWYTIEQISKHTEMFDI